jgi:hypothetical protein
MARRVVVEPEHQRDGDRHEGADQRPLHEGDDRQPDEHDGCGIDEPHDGVGDRVIGVHGAADAPHRGAGEIVGVPVRGEALHVLESVRDDGLHVARGERNPEPHRDVAEEVEPEGDDGEEAIGRPDLVGVGDAVAGERLDQLRGDDRQQEVARDRGRVEHEERPEPDGIGSPASPDVAHDIRERRLQGAVLVVVEILCPVGRIGHLKAVGTDGTQADAPPADMTSAIQSRLQWFRAQADRSETSEDRRKPEHSGVTGGFDGSAGCAGFSRLGVLSGRRRAHSLVMDARVLPVE